MRISGVPPAVVPFHDRPSIVRHFINQIDLNNGGVPTNTPVIYTVPANNFFLLFLVKLEIARVTAATTVGLTFIELLANDIPLFKVRGKLPAVDDAVLGHFPCQIWLPAGTQLRYYGLDSSTGGLVRAEVWFAGIEVPIRPG